MTQCSKYSIWGKVCVVWSAFLRLIQTIEVISRHFQDKNVNRIKFNNRLIQAS